MVEVTQVSNRFQIEDLVVQDASGVVFRALDTQTGDFVALRRFFPSGADGGGLNAAQQHAYQETVGRLAAVTHPALRSIISGDCDPIDGMPYIATEWIEGSRLRTCLEQGPITPEEVAHVLTQALEVSQILSGVLGEEGIWIETGLEAIVIGAEKTGRTVTFWIAPQKWLGKNDSRHGLECIVELTETLMGWHGKRVSDHAGKGLGLWLKWLRGAKATATLQEVREMLAASTGADSPASATRLYREAFQQKRSKSHLLWILVAGLVLLAAAVGTWTALNKKPPEIPPPSIRIVE
ncbi:hypothetical protein JIN84_03620 [Luteolibacter yonseiensis]|uniref:Serine/threonine protein kinase n=1 Tax=Luteolibacter yonseiensis TaxID=1144680 RepID=A0A934VAB3_9BACT|nr:hypothetical protein [Luteolibacter yonseiensis]MBK1814686.1 hypothetical protein [Luteolibacter yonseiensis]